ncbi:hypothetical protein LCGC14_2999120 [marine sediment metagenome]|uniref:Response regulatory domain-containing protein n=1 Tax=marine sediment metagenome TaxID=412755 RepID=A0A0F8XP67_9ZZZZ
MSMKIMIVDPDWYFLSQARGILEDCGHQVAQQSDPAEAMERAAQWRPDVILANVELPEVSDGELLGQFAAIRPRPAILLVSALDRFDKAWHAWQRGGDEVLFKPILHPSELHVAIRVARENALCPEKRPAADRFPLAISA